MRAYTNLFYFFSSFSVVEIVLTIEKRNRSNECATNFSNFFRKFVLDSRNVMRPGRDPIARVAGRVRSCVI